MQDPELSEQKAANVKFPPPLIYLFALVSGAIADSTIGTLPFPLGPGIAPAVAGGTLLVAGAAAIVMSFRHFQRTNQDPKPWKPTPEIIDTGIYGHSRNPMYLGMATLLAGFGFLLGNTWILALVPVSLALNYVIAVRPEEAYLETLFGEPYLAYKRRVRRWI